MFVQKKNKPGHTQPGYCAQTVTKAARLVFPLLGQATSMAKNNKGEKVRDCSAKLGAAAALHVTPQVLTAPGIICHQV